MGISITNPSEIAGTQLDICGKHDIQELYYAESGIIYYMYIPKRYFTYKVIQLSLVSFLLAFLSHVYVLMFLIPLYVVHFFKVKIFVLWCKTINFSPIKLWIFFAVELFIFEIINIFLRSFIWSLIA